MQRPADRAPQDSLKRGIKFLLKQQSPSGAWKSEYYGNLKQGAATTSLSLFAFSCCDRAIVIENKKAIAKGFEFLKLGIEKYGFVANPSGPDYSNYATALTLLAHANLKEKLDHSFLSKEQKQKLVAFLIASQVDETHGLKPTADDYGGWDLSGWMQGVRSSPGTNVSISSFVLLALNRVETKDAAAAKNKARKWLVRIQNPDHGFHFHPKKDHDGNKAEWTDKENRFPRSYGTATVDGIRMLRCLKFDRAKIDEAGRWLDSQHRETSLKKVPGFQGEVLNNDSWAQGLVFYYYMSLALEQESLSTELQSRLKKEIPLSLVKTSAEKWKLVEPLCPDA